MAVESLGYDNPVYTARHQYQFGSGDKFLCFTNVTLFSIGIKLDSKVSSDLEFTMTREGNSSNDSVVITTNTFKYKLKASNMTDKGGFVSFALNEEAKGGLSCNPGDEISFSGLPGRVTLEFGVQPLAKVTV